VDEYRVLSEVEKSVGYKINAHLEHGYRTTRNRLSKALQEIETSDTEGADEIKELMQFEEYNSALNTDDENDIVKNSICVPIEKDDYFPYIDISKKQSKKKQNGDIFNDLPLGYVLKNNTERFKLSFQEGEMFDRDGIVKNNMILDFDIPSSDCYQSLSAGFNASLYLELVNPVQDLLAELFYDKKTQYDIEKNLEYRRCHIILPDSQYQGPYYNLDEDGKLGLEYRHLKPLMKRIRETGLVQKVKDEVPNMPMKNVQKDSYDAFMCNENVYGTINLIAVYGFLKME